MVELWTVHSIIHLVFKGQNRDSGVVKIGLNGWLGA